MIHVIESRVCQSRRGSNWDADQIKAAKELISKAYTCYFTHMDLRDLELRNLGYY